MPDWLLVVALYVVPGLILTRIVYRYRLLHDEDGTPPNPMVGVGLLVVAMFVGWLAGLALTAFAVLYGAYRLATLPTRAERRQRRLAAMEDERDRVRAEARRLGLPMLEDPDG